MESGVIGFIAMAVLMFSILWFIFSLGKGILRGLFVSKPHETSADNQPARLDHLPEQFIVFDLETTGLDAGKDEIIEFGAIRANRDSNYHETLQILVRPNRKIPKRSLNSQA